MRGWRFDRGGFHPVERAPRKPSGDEARVKVRHVGICGSDWAKFRRPEAFDLPAEWIPGHEIVGTDEAGRFVAVEPLLPCHACAACRRGDTHLCSAMRRLGWDLAGGFCDEIVVPRVNLHVLPEGVSPVVAVLADTLAVALHGIEGELGGLSGRMLVVGAGPVGLLSGFCAAKAGWDVTVAHRAGREPSATLGLRCLPANELAGSEPFDAVVDAGSGHDASAMAAAIGAVRDGGVIPVQNAYLPGLALPVPMRTVFGRSLRLIGAFSYRSHGPAPDFARALALLETDAARLATLLEPPIPFATFVGNWPRLHGTGRKVVVGAG